MSKSNTLRRELGLPAAVALGLGSILGTGIFVSVGLVTGLAGSWTVFVVLGAAFVATCNALSSAQLAAAYPCSGGTYEYGYRVLHPTAGFAAGWMFLCAKSASAATAALGFAGYLITTLKWDAAPLAHTAVAGAVVVFLTLLVAMGVRRSSQANTVIVSVTVLALVAFVVVGVPRVASGVAGAGWAMPRSASLLEALALMFVAYTGYGRVATMGEEVRNPRTTIPKAIILTLAVSAFLYAAVGLVSTFAVDATTLRAATEVDGAPLQTVARSFGMPGIAELVAVGAMTAMLGVLLNLILGLSRLMLAMGRRHDMPRGVTRVDPRRSNPRVSVLVTGGIVLILVLVGSIKLAWSFSAFTVLIYYAITNVAALRLPRASRLYPRIWAVVGLLSCVALAFCVEPRVWRIGLGVLGAGGVWFAVARRYAPSPEETA